MIGIIIFVILVLVMMFSLCNVAHRSSLMEEQMWENMNKEDGEE